MSAARVQVATAHCSVFGSVVQDVVGTLFRPGRHTLQSLSRALSKGAMVKESLIVLLQHNLIKATETEDGTVFYDVNVQDLLWRGRIPRYLQVVERKFDQLGAEIIEFLFSHGRARLSHIRRGLLGADSQSDLALQRKFTELLDARLVVRMIVYSSEDDRSLITEADLYSLPAECRALFLSDAGVKRKRRDSNEPQLADEENDDATIYWRVNVDAINRLLRNEWIVKCLASRLDKRAAQITQLILDLAPSESPTHTGPVSYFQLANKLQGVMATSMIKEYLDVLTCDSRGVVIRCSEAQGGEFQIDISKATALARELVIEKIILEKFGDCCHRLYHLLVLNPNMEQKQLSEKALVASFKETKSALNELFRAGFIQLQELPKPGDRSATAKNYFFWTVNPEVVLANTLDRLYRTTANLNSRAEHEKLAHARLLRQHVDVSEEYLETARPDRIREKQSLALSLGKVQKALDALALGQYLVEEQIFLLQGFC
eukprot:m.92785 g.92785  ORF g.92785 m.92785 type:complete len:489 (+) comp51176_c0_seq3:26-1492(+)